MKNRILLILIGIFVVILSLIASHTPINWTYFSLSSVIMGGLIYLQKRELRKTFSENNENGLSLKHFLEKLYLSLDIIKELVNENDEEKYKTKLTELIDEIFPNIDEYRISIINMFGVANYTNIAIPFAKAERIINRGVSAAVDGYLAESKNNITVSINLLKIAIDEINRVIKNG